MTVSDILLLALAGLTAGTVNAVAGGGTFLTFAAFTAAGLAPGVANASSAVALTPANLGSSLGYLAEIRTHWRRYRWFGLVAMLGGLLGAWLFLHTPGATFRAIVPWCLAFATLLFAFAPTLRRVADRLASGPPGARWLRTRWSSRAPSACGTWRRLDPARRECARRPGRPRP